jgi:hypothetical protein
MSVVVLLVVVALAAIAALGRPALSLCVLVSAALLLPATMVLPRSPTAALTGLRLIEIGCAIGAFRAPRPAASRATPYVLLVLMAYAGVSCVTGLAYASPQIDAVQASYRWLGIFDQVIVALVALSLMRLLRTSQVALILAGGAILSGLVGLEEWASGSSWARTVLRAADPGTFGVPSAPLEHRNGLVRIRGATEFALAYGWLMAALLPVTVVAVFLTRRLLSIASRAVLAAGVPLVVAAVYLSRSRSPLLAVLVASAVLLAVLAPRRPAVLLVLGALVVGGAFWLGPDVLHHLSPSVDQASVDTRVQRLPQVLDLVSAHPYRGVGLTGIQMFGPGNVDSTFLQIYVEAGAVAVTLLVLALVAPTLVIAWAAVRGPLDEHRQLALACSLGMAALIGSAAFFDAFTTLSSAFIFWLLAGAGLVAAERSVGPLPRPRWSEVLAPVRLAALLAAVGLGIAVRALVPSHAAATTLYATLDTKTATTTYLPGMSRTLVTTACQAARDGITPHRPWRVATCEELPTQGWVRLQVRASNASEVEEGLTALHDGFRSYPHLFAVQEVRGISIVSGIPTIARVAPLVLGIVAATTILLVPGRRRNRSH